MGWDETLPRKVPRNPVSHGPSGPTYTTIMELGPQNQNRDGSFGPNSIVGVYGPSG